MYHSFVRQLNRVTEYVAMSFLVIMVLLVFFQIISRAISGFSFSWTEEVARYLLVWVSFLASGFAYQYGAHVSIEVLVNKFNIKAKNVFAIIGAMISISFAIILIITGFELSMESMTNTSPALHLPMSLVYFAIPLGAILQIINIIDLLLKGINKSRNLEVNE